MDGDPVDALYGLPLAAFVAARNALAKELKRPEIQKLKKPSGTAWVLNQLARKAPDEVEALLAAGRKVAESQAGAVRGRGSAPFREAVHAEREALNPLLSRARKLVKGESAMLKVADALRAAAADPAAGEALRAGRLTEEPQVGAFGAFEAAGSFEPAAAGVGEGGNDEEAERRARLDRERREAEQDLEKAEGTAARAEARAAEAEQRAAHLRAEADEARGRADDAARRVADLS